MSYTVTEARVVFPDKKTASSFSSGYASKKPCAHIDCDLEGGFERSIWIPVRVARVYVQNRLDLPCDWDDFREAVKLIECKCALTMVTEMLSRRDHATGEVRDKLARYGFRQPAIDFAVNRAIEYRFLDENRFCSYFIEERKRRGWGQRKIETELKRRHVALDEIPGYPEAYFADYRNRNRVRMQDLKEAIGVESRSTIFNPEYIKEVMKGGASSASQITEVVTNTYGWNVTKPEVIDDAMWNQIYDVYVTDSYKLGTEDFFKQQNPAALQEITAVMLETARKGMWKASEQQIGTLANLHTDLVKEFGSAGSGFAGGNAKLQDYIASRVQPERATVYKEQIQSMKTAQVATDKKGMVLKKDEVAQAERGEKNALNGVWIAGGVFALFVILLLVLKKKRKGN